MDMQSPFEAGSEFDRLIQAPSAEEPDTDTSDEPDASDAEPSTYFPNLEVFVTEYLVHHYPRPVDPMGHQKEFTWCSSWWAHTEAVSRLNALWRAWETLRLDPGTGMSDWWRIHADPTMRALFYNNGPFKGCTIAKHAPTASALPVVAAPPDLFAQP